MVLWRQCRPLVLEAPAGRCHLGGLAARSDLLPLFDLLVPEALRHLAVPVGQVHLEGQGYLEAPAGRDYLAGQDHLADLEVLHRLAVLVGRCHR